MAKWRLLNNVFRGQIGLAAGTVLDDRYEDTQAVEEHGGVLVPDDPKYNAVGALLESMRIGGASPQDRQDLFNAHYLKESGVGGIISSTVAALPLASSSTGQQRFVTDEAGGPTLAISDGTFWRRVADRVVVSALPLDIILNGQSNMAAGGRGSFGFTANTQYLHADIKGVSGFTSTLVQAVDGTANAKANAGGGGAGQGPGLGQIGSRLCRLIRDARSAQGLNSVVRTVALAYTSQGSAYFRPDSATLAFFENGSQHATKNNYNLIKEYVQAGGLAPQLWVHGQGEANAGQSQSAVYADFKATFDQSRIDYPGIRWLLIGTIGGPGQRGLVSLGPARVYQIDDPTGSPVFVDETADANSVGAGDVQPWPAGEAVGDQFAIGHDDPFWFLSATIATSGVGGTLTVKYWNGSAWTAVPGLLDVSQGFTSAPGVVTIRWAKPHDWVKRSLDGTQQLHYVVFEVATTYSTNPVLSRIQITTHLARGGSLNGVYAAQKQLADENPGVVFLVDNRDMSPHTALFGGFAGNHYTRRGYKMVADRCYATLRGETWEPIPAEPVLSHIDDLGVWTHGFSDIHSTSTGDAFTFQGDLSGFSSVDIGTGPSHVAADQNFDGATVADFDRANSENCSVSGALFNGAATMAIHFVAKLRALTQSQALCELRDAGFANRIAFHLVHQSLAHAFFYDTGEHFFDNAPGPADTLVHSYALVIDTSTLTGSVYVDGNLYGTQVIDNSESIGALILEIGALASSDHLDGQIAHIRLAVGIAPTPAQIAAAHVWARAVYNLP